MNDVVIVGGGVAGLACAQRLREGGLRPIVLEGSDEVGGRARSDVVDGFRLDRGFHLLTPSSVEVRLALDCTRLDLRPLARGALVRAGSRFRHEAEPQSGGANDRVAVPARGIGAVAAQLAEGVDVRRRAVVASVGPGAAVLRGGERLTAAAVVVATAGLVDDAVVGWASRSCLYFEAPRPPLPGAWLVRGDGEGPIQTLCALTEVAAEYAPPGRTLVAVGAVTASEPAVREQLGRWFGGEVREWRRLRTYHLPHAFPVIAPGRRLERPARIARGLYACGDHRQHPSLPGALASGRRAAEAVLLDLAVSTSRSRGQTPVGV